MAQRPSVPRLRKRRVLAVANQKGGVAKTTTVHTLGVALAERGLKVLLVDLDPQASLTYCLGVDPGDVHHGVPEVLSGAADVGQVTITGLYHPTRADVGQGQIDLVPAHLELASSEIAILRSQDRLGVLRRALEPVQGYQAVIIDCSPSLGMLTLNALAAADQVLVPVQCEMLAHRGVGQLLDTIADVRDLTNPKLTVLGLVPTMFDGRCVHSQAVLADLIERFGLPVMTPIPKTVRFAEAPAAGSSVLHTANKSKGAAAYRDLADRVIKAWRKG